MSTAASEPLPEDHPAKTRSQRWREVLRVCLVAVVTFATLIPVIIPVIQGDAEGWIAEMLVQTAIVAGVLTKIINIPAVDAWLKHLGVDREAAGMKPLPGQLPVEPEPEPGKHAAE